MNRNVVATHKAIKTYIKGKGNFMKMWVHGSSPGGGRVEVTISFHPANFTNECSLFDRGRSLSDRLIEFLSLKGCPIEVITPLKICALALWRSRNVKRELQLIQEMNDESPKEKYQITKNKNQINSKTEIRNSKEGRSFHNIEIPDQVGNDVRFF